VEEPLHGDSGDLGELEKFFSLEEVLFYLVVNGVPEHLVYGWHDGWDFDRLNRLFLYLKKRELENLQAQVNAVSIGASSIMSNEAYKGFMANTNKAIQEISNRESKSPESPSKNVHLAEQMSKLGQVLMGDMSIFDGR